MTPQQFHSIVKANVPIRTIRGFHQIAFLIVDARLHHHINFNLKKLKYFILKATRKDRLQFLIRTFFYRMEAGLEQEYLINVESHRNFIARELKRIGRKHRRKLGRNRRKDAGSIGVTNCFAGGYFEYVNALSEARERREEREKAERKTGHEDYTSPILGSSWIGDELTPPPLEE